MWFLWGRWSCKWFLEIKIKKRRPEGFAGRFQYLTVIWEKCICLVPTLIQPQHSTALQPLYTLTKWCKSEMGNREEEKESSPSHHLSPDTLFIFCGAVCPALLKHPNFSLSDSQAAVEIALLSHSPPTLKAPPPTQTSLNPLRCFHSYCLTERKILSVCPCTFLHSYLIWYQGLL